MQLINGVYYFPRESDSKEGFAVRPPKNYTPDTRYPVVVLVHGIGERGQGDIAALQNVVDGFDYDGAGPLPRQYAIETPEFEAMIERFQFIGVTVNYPLEFNPNDFNYVLDTVEQRFSVDTTRECAICFSLGGGAGMRYITSSISNAKRLAFIVLAAPVNWATNTQNVVDAGLQVIGTTCEKDPRVSPTNIKNFISAISATVPKPVLIVYPGEGHSGFLEVINNTWIFEYLLKTSRENRVQFVAPGATTPVPGPIEPTTMQPVVAYSSTGPAFNLDATKSTGYKYAAWRLTGAPDGVNIYNPYIKGAGYERALFTAPQPGRFELEMILTDAAGKQVKTPFFIEYGTATPVIKTVQSFDGSMITYSDNSTEAGRAIYSGGKWEIVAASGTKYQV